LAHYVPWKFCQNPFINLSVYYAVHTSKTNVDENNPWLSSVGDIRSQIAAEWLHIAQRSQWRAYRKPNGLCNVQTFN